MSLLIALFVGVAVGLLVGFFLLDNADFLIINACMGIAGSILGLAFYYFLLRGTDTISLFSLPATLCSVIGSLIAVLGFDGLHTIMPTRASNQNVENSNIDED